MAINLGSTSISKLYLGSTEITKAYLGATEVFSVATGPFTPANITTELWLDADDATTIIESGGLVSQWNDKSGKGYNYTQGTGANQPITGTRTINSKNVIDFNGSAHFMELASGFQAETNAILMLVIVSDTTDGVKRVFNNQVGTGTRFAVYEDNLLLSAIKFPSFNTHTISRVNGSNLIGVCDDGNALCLGYNASYTESATDDGDVDTLDKWFLGCYNGLSEFFDGGIAEVVYVKSYDLTTRQKLEGYLAHKWGLTENLPGGHPYKLTPP